MVGRISGAGDKIQGKGQVGLPGQQTMTRNRTTTRGGECWRAEQCKMIGGSERVRVRVRRRTGKSS